MSDVLTPGARVHVIGCSGAGMSAVVRLLVGRGCVVSGCDRSGGQVLARLANEGATVFDSHRATHLDSIDVVIASPAVSTDHPELVAARRRAVTILSRPEVMSELCSMAPVIGFAGTHGKTTTTSMAVHVWNAAGRSPSWLIGAPVRGLGANGHWRDGAELLVEVDESYGAFAKMAPLALGVANVDPDHLDFYGDVATLEAAFVDLVDRTSGPVVVWADQPGSQRVASRARRRVRRVGRGADAHYRVSNEEFTRAGSRFELRTRSAICEIVLAVPGALNVTNAALAASVAFESGISALAVAEGLAAFTGAPRRFEHRGEWRGTAIVDDYAHLPSEVAATIAAARSAGYESIAAVFQPHRVTRTAALAESFAGAFAGVDNLVVTDIYRAGEANPRGLTGRVVADAVGAGASAPHVRYVSTLDDAAEALRAYVGVVDLILVLGAGDVDSVIPRLEKLVRS